MVHGPDGRLWFTEWDAGTVGAITTAGMVSEYTLPGRGTSGIAVAEDGAVWVGSYAGQVAYLDRVNASGQVTHSLQLPAGGGVNAVVRGHAGTNTIWFTYGGLDRIGRVSAVPDAGPPPPPAADPRPSLKLRKLPKGHAARGQAWRPAHDLGHLQPKPVTSPPRPSCASVKLTLKLSAKAKRAARRALRHKRRASVLVSVTATDSAGQTATATAKVKLKR